MNVSITRFGGVIIGAAGLLAVSSASAAATPPATVHAPLHINRSIFGTPTSHRIQDSNLAAITDPTGDVVLANGQATTQPAADLTGASVTDNATTITMSATVATYSDPATDPAWGSAYTGIDWQIDTTVPGSDEYDALLYTNSSSVPSVEVFSNAGGKASPVCTGTFSGQPGTNTYQISFPATCIASPQFFRYAVVTSYDTSLGDTTGNRAAVDIAPNTAADATPEGEPGVVAGGTSAATQGYWLFTSDGQVFNHGTAGFYGSAAAIKLKQPIISAVPTNTGKGYWLVAKDGGVFTYGDAGFYGSTGNLRLNSPVISLIPTQSGAGYWLVAADGGIFSFGDAKFYGSTGATHLNAPIVGLSPTASGSGYMLVASDGGIFTFGDATFQGSTGGLKLNAPIVGVAPTSTGSGYRLVGSDGGIFTFGTAEYDGSEGASGLGDVFVATAAQPVMPA